MPSKNHDRMLALLGATERLRRRPWLGDMFALMACAAATWLRYVVDDTLPDGYPFLTFFPAVIVTTFLFGLRPGVLCATLCGVSAWYFFIPPDRSFSVDARSGLALVFYAFVVSIDILLIHLMHSTGMRLRAERQVTAGLYERQRTLFQELQHRVANNLSHVGAMLTLQRRRVAEDPSCAVEVMDDARVRLETMSRIHRRLYDPDRIEMPTGKYLEELCSDLLEATAARNIVCMVEAPSIRLDLARLTTLSLLVVEVVTNALKHAFRDGSRGVIRVRVERVEGGLVSLTVSDDGRGLPEGFDPAASRRLGFRISQGLAAQLDGTLTYDNDNGARVRVVFPEAA